MHKLIIAALCFILIFSAPRYASAQVAPQSSVPPNTPPAASSQILEINTLLMKCTFMIAGADSNDPSKISCGTSFILVRPKKGDPTFGYFVLITADHVMESIGGTKATLLLHKAQADGTYTVAPFSINIRDDKNKQLWLKNPDADVAVMYVSLPKGIDPSMRGISTNLLADDSMMNQYEMHPGDQLFCLGFPYGNVSTSGALPTLRGGTIASYPLTPAKSVKQIIFDFPVFPGNSGGPVYMSQSNRLYANSMHLGETERMVVGIVTQSHLQTIPINGGAGQLSMTQPLSLATIVPAKYILDTVNMLPDSPPTP